MRDALTAKARDLWARINRAADSESKAEAIVDWLRSQPESRQWSLLSELATKGDGDQQAWVVATATDVLGDRAAPILQGLINNGRDDDVRTDAVHALAAIDVGLVRPLIRSFRRALRSKTFDGPVTAIWMLARIDDVDSLPDIERLATDPDRPWVRFSAQVATMILCGEGTRVLDLIRSHDHLRMPWLAIGAAVLGTPAAAEALRNCANTAPDRECAVKCGNALRDLERSSRSRVQH